MKIILLNPFINAEHSVARSLQKKGIGLLLATNPEEAWQILQLHGSSVDLAIIHREGTSQTDAEPGMKFITRVKGDAAQQDLPIIVTSGIWRDVEFARHQQTATGANAYLSAPFHEKQLTDLIEAVLGQTLQDEPTQAPTGFPIAQTHDGGPEIHWTEPVEAQASGFSGAIQLEEVASLGDDTPSDHALLEPPAANNETSIISIDDGLTTLSLGDDVALPPRPPSRLEAVPPEFSDPPGLPIPEDDVALREMSYLFGDDPKVRGDSSRPPAQTHHAALIGQPVGDSIVPGGASQAPDTETLKKYLMLREQDVSVLSSQLRTAQEQMQALESHLREERAKSEHLEQIKTEQDRKLEHLAHDKAAALEGVQGEIVELNFQLKSRSDKAKAMEYQVREAATEMERLKERVRVDIRKIRVRERELENRLEIVKKDSEALIGAREHKIIELKRKLDILEFNLDLLQNQYNREKENSTRLKDRLVKAAQVVKMAGGLLQPSGTSDGDALQSKVKSQDASDREAS